MSLISTCKKCIPTEQSPTLLVPAWSPTQIKFSLFEYLDPSSQHSLTVTCKAGRRVIDMGRCMESAIPLKKEIYKIENSPKERSIARKKAVEKFFTSRKVEHLHPLVITALFNSLHSEAVETCFDSLPKQPKWNIIGKIATYFFHSASTTDSIEKLTPDLYHLFKTDWDRINKNPGYFSNKLTFLGLYRIFFYIGMITNPECSEKFVSLVDGELADDVAKTIYHYCKWAHDALFPNKGASVTQPPELRPICHYVHRLFGNPKIIKEFSHLNERMFLKTYGCLGGNAKQLRLKGALYN